MATKIVRSGPQGINIGGDKIVTGTWFTGKIGHFPETIFLKGSCEIIGWTDSGTCSDFTAEVMIENYQGINVEIKIL